MSKPSDALKEPVVERHGRGMPSLLADASRLFQVAELDIFFRRLMLVLVSQMAERMQVGAIAPAAV